MNVATPEVVSLRELAETIGRLIGRSPLFEITDRAPLRLVPAVDRLATYFDPARFRSLVDGLRGTISAEIG
jgi:nucleoside-diphosphate-sugar epimerase